MSCAIGGFVVGRHNHITGQWANYLTENQDFDNVEIEQIVPGANADTAPRLDINAVDASGQVLSLDITVANPCTPTALEAGSAVTAGAAARLLEMVKRRKYPNIDVSPIAIEAHGRLGPATLEFIKKLGKHIDPHLRPKHIASLQQDVACALQRANATSILKAAAAVAAPT